MVSRMPYIHFQFWDKMVLAEGTTLRLKSTIIPILARDNCRNWPPLMIPINQISVLCSMNWRSYCKNQEKAFVLYISFNIYIFQTLQILSLNFYTFKTLQICFQYLDFPHLKYIFLLQNSDFPDFIRFLFIKNQILQTLYIFF